MTCSAIREIDSFAALCRQEGQLNCAVIQGLDLRLEEIDWPGLQCAGAVFLGCQFPDHVDLNLLRDKGAMFFPRMPNLPYEPYRHSLYTREELMSGWTPERDGSADKRIYKHFHKKGGNAPDVIEAMTQRIHDHAIDDALRDLLEGRVERDGKKKVVAVMGGHGTPRTDPYYAKIAYITRELSRGGYFIASG